jgi:hypothetical protein
MINDKLWMAEYFYIVVRLYTLYSLLITHKYLLRKKEKITRRIKGKYVLVDVINFS